jgi:hypothetical protein
MNLAVALEAEDAVPAQQLFFAPASVVGDNEKGVQRMSLYKRGKTWVDVVSAGGQRTRCSAGTTDRHAAKEFHDKLKAETWRTDKLGERPQRTWDEAAVRFLKDAPKASIGKYRAQVAFWTKHLRGEPLPAIDAERVAGLIEEYTDTPATRNRYVACIRALLRKAVRWGWLDRAPMFTTYSKPTQRIRWITEEQATALLAVLPEWLREIGPVRVGNGTAASECAGP